MFQLLMISALLLQLARGVWMIEPNAAQAYYPIVKALLSGQQVDYSALLPQQSHPAELKQQIELQRREFTCMALNMNEPMAHQPSMWYGFDKAPKNSVALIPLHGAVMKYDYCGEAGTTTLSRWIAEADAHPNIIGTVFSIDSPGGAANGTADFSTCILKAQKPVVSYTHGMMCSAAYWPGSAAREIIASNSTGIIGSIGTYMTLEDWSKRLEDDGIKVHEIYADASSEKNGIIKEAFAGNYKPLKEQIINPLNDAFLSAVKKNRYGKGLKADKVLKGRTFMAEEAIDMGLIDRIGTLADAVKAVQKYAKT